jgi:hypothetical protein
MYLITKKAKGAETKTTDDILHNNQYKNIQANKTPK